MRHTHDSTESVAAAARFAAPCGAIAPRGDAVVEIAGLCHWFGDGPSRRQVLTRIDLAIHPGEIVIMTGPSGSGKTTLLTLIGALRTAQDGRLRVFGQEMVQAAAAVQIATRRRIGYIFQGHNLLKFLTARQNVGMSLELQPTRRGRERADRAAEILTAVGLAHRMDDFPPRLSGGERQRVAIARALAAEPGLILADEPTASLDRKTGHEVVVLLTALARRRGTAVLLVTHDNRILDAADRVVHLEDGCIAAGPS